MAREGFIGCPMTMHEKRSGWWLSWVLFAGLVVGVPVLLVQLSLRGRAGRDVTTDVEGHGWPRTLVERLPDGREGRRLVLPAPPQRIVSVTLATDEILLDLVGSERIAALSDFARTPESMIKDRVGHIGRFVSADAESIIALEPDLCFLASYNRDETRSLLIDSGIPVYVFHCFRGLEDIRSNLRMVGRAVGAEERAEQLVADMDRKIAAVARRLPDRQRWPTALVYGTSGWVEGAGGTQTEVFEAAGVRNAAAERGIRGFAQVSEEAVLEMDPDYLVVLVGSYDVARQKEWLLGNPALATLRAIRQERFVSLREALLTSVSHHVADAVDELARQVHPNGFSGEQQ